jgi:hypothetical protein
MPLTPKMPPKEATHKVGDYGLVTKFVGYRAREDNTTLPIGTLIAPSQNVVIKTSGRVSLVKGYTLDGAGSTVIDSGILSNFDFINFKGDVRNLRAGFLTSAANDGKLQYRYLDTTSTVNWVTLKGSLTNVRLSYTEYWDNTALVKLVTWVDGSNNVFQWNGAVTTLASATATTVTKQGTTTWAQEGFSATGSIVIGGVSATYSGGTASTTLTGVSVDFSASPIASIVHQDVVTTGLGSITGILATFGPTVIGCGRRNQVYYGASNSNVLYISKVNNFADVSFTTPTRVVGEGALIPLDAAPTGFIPLESRTDTNAYDMVISEGLNNWSIIRATLSADLTKETLEHIRMKVAPLQGAKSSRLMSKMKNHIIFVGNDSVANFMGYTSFQYVPETVDFSWPIIDDMTSYDFTDASIYYSKNYIYVTIPKSGIIRIFNMTDQTKQTTSSIRGVEDVDPDQPWFWEAPVTYPISGFYYTPDKGLCGHSYTTSESYQLFTSGKLNGQQIVANATFSYDDKGDRTQSKGSNELWIEGYIKQNTTLSATVTGDLNTFATSQTVTVNGSDSAIVAYGSGAHSLGTTPLGSEPLGGANISAALSAWFHCAKTYVQVPFYLESVSFNTQGVDLDWELICFGSNATETPEGNNAITE